MGAFTVHVGDFTVYMGEFAVHKGGVFYPERRKQPTVMSAAAPKTHFLKPKMRDISVKQKHDTTFVNRKMSISSSAPCCAFIRDIPSGRRD